MSRLWTESVSAIRFGQLAGAARERLFVSGLKVTEHRARRALRTEMQVTQFVHEGVPKRRARGVLQR